MRQTDRHGWVHKVHLLMLEHEGTPNNCKDLVPYIKSFFVGLMETAYPTTEYINVYCL
jgi:hypothetical protein